MAEHSDSYHLRTRSRQDGIGLLRAAGLRGYVFPPENGWVTVLPEGASYQPSPRLIAASRGVLLHYALDAGEGWRFEPYHDGRAVARHELDWSNGIRVVADETDLAVLGDLLGEGFRALTEEERRAIFHPTGDAQWLREEKVAPAARALRRGRRPGELRLAVLRLRRGRLRRRGGARRRGLVRVG